MDNVKTGQFIASVRKSRNMTQKDIAEKLHITSKAVSKWERGLSFPSIDILQALARALDVTVMDLLAGEIIQPKDVVEKTGEISVRVLRKEKRLRKLLLTVCAAGLIVIALMLYIWGPAIFQRGNPLPYLMAAMKISDEQPYVQVDSRPGVYISRRGSCPELFDDIETDRKLNFIEQAGSAYLFSNGVSNLIVSSEIYWGKYTVWTVPQVTLR